MNLQFEESENKGVRITHKNSFLDNYDPVVSLKMINGLFVVDNTYHTYTVPISNVSRVEIYDLVLKVDSDFEDITWYDDENFETVYEV